MGGSIHQTSAESTMVWYPVMLHVWQTYLVGGWTLPPWKIWLRQLGLSSQLLGKIKLSSYLLASIFGVTAVNPLHGNASPSEAPRPFRGQGLRKASTDVLVSLNLARSFFLGRVLQPFFASHVLSTGNLRVLRQVGKNSMNLSYCGNRGETVDSLKISRTNASHLWHIYIYIIYTWGRWTHPWI